MTTTAPATTAPPTPSSVVGDSSWPCSPLAVGGFAIGTTEFVTMGLLPQIAEGIGVSEPKAGYVISAYALGVVVGVLILSFFAALAAARGLLVGLMAAYGVFNLLSAAATGYGMHTFARFLDGLPHGAYFGVASSSRPAWPSRGTAAARWPA